MMARPREPLVSEPTSGVLSHGSWPGWEEVRRRGLAGRVNGEVVARSVKIARERYKQRRPTSPVVVGHLLAELDRMASGYFGEWEGAMILKDQLAARPRRLAKETPETDGQSS
jgi:hypothetical protein